MNASQNRKVGGMAVVIVGDDDHRDHGGYRPAPTDTTPATHI